MDFLKWLFVEIIRDTVIGWMNDRLATHANRQRPGDPAPTSVHVGWLSKALGPVLSLLMTALAVVVWLGILNGAMADNVWISAVFFSVIAVLFWLGSYDALIRRIEWDDRKVRFRRWNSDHTVSWSDIVELQEKSFPPHMRIAFRDGSGFGFSETMNGSRYFMRMLERRLSPKAPEPGNKRRKRRQRAK
jgi:hypothetical protein